MKKLVIIDTHALVHRSYHALPPLVSPDGILVNGVYGFMLVFLKMLKDLRPDYVLAAFDMAVPTFRHKEYKEYKAKRVKMPDNFYQQIQIVKDLLQGFKISILEKKEYEADDIIGSVTEGLKDKKDIQSIIVTGDLDTLQLVNDKVFVYTLRRGLQDRVIYNPAKVQERFQLEPEQLVDWKALKGDPSDNVPGVPSIGEKTARELIKKFHDLDNLYQKMKQGEKIEVSPRILEKLKEFEDQAYFSRHLVTIQKDVAMKFDLKKAEFNPPAKENLVFLLNKLGFRSLIPKIFNSEERTASAPEEISLKIINTPQKTEELAQKINQEQTIGILLDFKDAGWGERKIKGLGFSFLDNTLFYLPKKFFKDFFDLAIGWSNKTLISFEAKVIYEELKEFSSCLFEDIKILAWLIDPERKNYKFSSLGKFFLKQDIDDSFEGCLVKLIPLWGIIKNKVMALGLGNVWEKQEKPLIAIISSMEKNGILVDRAWLEKLTREGAKEIADLEGKIYQLVGKSFNLNSPQQLAAILFEELGISSEHLRKTATKKISTDIAELSKIEHTHSAIPLIIQYRGMEKLRSSFLNPLPNFINAQTKRIHTIWKQTGTATGRLSSEKPNLQNIPQRGVWGKKIRKAFIAGESFSLLSLDYSQIELRLAAHLSRDMKMMEIFKQDKDIHTITAGYIYNLPEQEVTVAMREQAKVLNFGIIYGMGNKAFAEAASIPLEEAKIFRKKYFSNFSGLKNYLDFSVEKAKKLGYAETIFGRKRVLPLLGTFGRAAQAQERIALNMPIQGLAADIIKMAMIKIQDFVKENHLEEKIKILLQIHDELILAVKSEIMKEIVPPLKEIMEEVVKLEIPLKIEIRTGKKWGEMERLNC